ncbi:hypothetical protein CRI94_07675 [Longibacter salinarum]|uniref:Uncharacterized protein n=1 Tax=Longibacter salinarum TaxID=1850348 RepID=A0A2A8CZ46_9BACT|nr:hypothetical protein [Longibacter salinarum]PEN13926.1 hypothetical protein CRI94_07675 [Longibacter salinarum]
MSDRLPLTQHIDTLYPIARVLVGDKTAPRLIRETYRRASSTPVEERPDDVEAWLVQLILEVRAGEGTMPVADDANVREAADKPSLADTRGFRHEVARGVAERALPVALAACSEQERALLTLYVSGTRTNDVLAPIAKTIASDIETALDEAYGELRAALRDILSGPERMLIDTALPDARLEEVLTAYVTDTYHPAPARLRSEVAALVRREAARLRGEEPDADSLRKDRERRISVHLRRTGLALLILTVIGAAAYGAATWLTPTPTSDPPPASVSLTEFSAHQVSGVEPLVRSSDPDSIAAVIGNRFNRSVQIPTIDGARVTSIGALTVDSATVPVILYTDTTTTSSITTYVYSYALIDRVERIDKLDDDLARGLDTADSLISRRVDDTQISLWRHRDDIFVAVTPAAVDSLAKRIRPTP